MERETIEVVLPISQKKIKIYKYLIGRDLYNFEKKKEEDLTKYVLNNFIVSFEGEKNKDKIFNMVMDLHIKDYKFIDRKLLSLIDPEKDKKK